MPCLSRLESLAVIAVAWSTAFIAYGANLPVGEWGGERVRLSVDERGAVIQTDCASGHVAGPIKLGVDGSFVAGGSFAEHSGGPQRADGATSQADARFSGHVRGDTMRLSVQRSGGQAALEFTLRRGATVKLVRCL